MTCEEWRECLEAYFDGSVWRTPYTFDMILAGIGDGTGCTGCANYNKTYLLKGGGPTLFDLLNGCGINFSIPPGSPIITAAPCGLLSSMPGSFTYAGASWDLVIGFTVCTQWALADPAQMRQLCGGGEIVIPGVSFNTQFCNGAGSTLTLRATPP